MRLPEEHNQLIRAVAKANPKTAVILSNGAPVEMPWADSVPAILETYLGGQAGGSAAADVLFGKVNPSGHLAETFPLILADTPCCENFPGGRYRVQYREGLHVGYRWYASANKPVRFPFGHGLSYTTFTFSKMELSRQSITLKTANTHQETTPLLEVSVTVKNTGQRSGKEVVQIYIRPKKSSVYRPEIELKGFAKILVEPGESAIVTIPLDARAFSFYNTAIGDWAVETGTYEILAGSSSESIHLTAAVQIRVDRPDTRERLLRENSAFLAPDIDGISYSDTVFAALLGREIPSDVPLEDVVTLNTPLRDLRGTVVGDQLHAGLLAGLANLSTPETDDVQIGTALSAVDEATKRLQIRQNRQKMIRMFERAIEGIPLRSAFMFSRGAVSFAQLEKMIRLLNQEGGAER